MTPAATSSAATVSASSVASPNIARGMHPNLLPLLACPNCCGQLYLSAITAADSNARVLDGSLACSRCPRVFTVARGIPRLLPQNNGPAVSLSRAELNTRDHFCTEFTAVSSDDHDLDLGDADLQEYFFYSRTGLDPALYEKLPGNFYRTSLDPGSYRPHGAALAGKKVLDAGCGPGRFLNAAAKTATLVVGLDFGEHVERAAQRTRALPNVAVVQGSVLSPPFRSGVFDFVYSVGVLHHTPNPRAGCTALARLISPAGSMSVWVYPPEYWGGAIRKPFNRAVNRILRRMSPERSLAICSRRLYPLGLLQARIARRRWTKWMCVPLFLISVPRLPRRQEMIATIYDYFGPPIISTHTADEVESWLRDAGFTHVKHLPVPTSCIASCRQIF